MAVDSMENDVTIKTTKETCIGPGEDASYILHTWDITPILSERTYFFHSKLIRKGLDIQHVPSVLPGILKHI